MNAINVRKTIHWFLDNWDYKTFEVAIEKDESGEYLSFWHEDMDVRLNSPYTLSHEEALKVLNCLHIIGFIQE